MSRPQTDPALAGATDLPPASDTETAVTAEPTAPMLDNDKFVTVQLMHPLQRGETLIDKVTLRKPTAGEMRGLNLQDVMHSDFAALIVIATRISDPILTPDEVSTMEVDDFSELAGAIRGFFMTKGEREVIELMIAQAQGKG